MKNTIKTLVMAAAMFVAVTTVAKAQGGGGARGGRGGGMGGRVMAVLKDSMHVSDAIAAKADSITKAYAAKQAEMMQAANGDMASVRPKMTEMQAEQTKDIKALLSADQQAQYDKIMAAFPQGRRGGGF